MVQVFEKKFIKWHQLFRLDEKFEFFFSIGRNMRNFQFLNTKMAILLIISCVSIISNTIPVFEFLIYICVDIRGDANKIRADHPSNSSDKRCCFSCTLNPGLHCLGVQQSSTVIYERSTQSKGKISRSFRQPKLSTQLLFSAHIYNMERK